MVYKIWKNKSTVKLVSTHENVIMTVNWELHNKGSRIYNTVLLVTHIMAIYWPLFVLDGQYIGQVVTA